MGWVSQHRPRRHLRGALGPLLGPLQDNGGQTPTMAPLPGSPVIDEGSSLGLTTDQRGKIRPFRYYPNTALPEGGDGSDIGACELTRNRPSNKGHCKLGLRLPDVDVVGRFRRHGSK